MRFIRLLTVLAVLMFALSLTAFSQAAERIFDAGILTGEEKSSMEKRLENISERLGFDIFIYVSEDGFEDFVSDKESLDGIVLFYSPEKKEYEIESLGKGKNVFGKDEVELIYAEIDEYFQRDKVYEGFNVYIRNAQKIWEQSEANSDSGAASVYRVRSRKRVMFTAFSLIAGMFAAMGITSSMKNKMNENAVNCDGFSGISLEIQEREDNFLYSEKEVY